MKKYKASPSETKPNAAGLQWAAASVCLLGFSIIAYFVSTIDVLIFDTMIREWIYSLRSDHLTLFFRSVTYLGNWQTVTLICIIIFVVRPNRWSPGLPMASAATIAVLLQKLLKTSFHRTRPDISLHLIQQGGFSFPSGHSFTVLVFYGMTIYLCRQKIKNRTAANTVTILLSLLIILIGLSRVYLGVHFPTDVLGGWLLGLCLLMILITVYQTLRSRFCL